MINTCHDCGAKEGEIHMWGCDMEECPFCGGQLISCDCSANLTKLDKKRIPYIVLPNYCRRCLKSFPDMFMVPDKEWAKMPISLKHEMLCKKCYNKISKWINGVRE